MDNRLKKVLNDTLENLAIDIVTQTGSVLLWGEEEIPDCLRKEVKKEEKE